MSDELPDINVTRGEKALAFVLAMFLLVGGLWVYFEPLSREAQPVSPTPQQRTAINARDHAASALADARDRQQRRLETYERAREDYRTDLDANTSTAVTKPKFEQARARLNAAQREVRDASAQTRRVSAAGDRAQRAVEQAQSDAQDAASRNTFLLRLGWVLACIALAFWLFNWLRRRRSAYFVAGVAAVIAATLQALVMAGDYLGDEIEWQDTGPLWIAIAGIVASVLALVGLERYLARRAPRRRVRKGQCPYCAYPVTGRHCEGCGRATVAACATCSADRRVGTAHCAACGAS
jgi:hypothetical protein